MGQKQVGLWYFGNFAGYNFNTTPPQIISDGQQIHLEGMSTISDYNGTLLFYTTGVEVWDRSQLLMPNGTGLMGHWSSTQSALIVPEPGNPDIYFIFTTDAGAYIDSDIEGLKYSVVNLCENNGYGDVIQTTKNTPLVKPTAEKLSAVYHDNGTDIWVVTHALNTNDFFAYLVTGTGVKEPVISSIGFIVKENDTVGQMKISVDGKRLGMSLNESGYIQVFDFNSKTGSITNPIKLGRSDVYGLEFSPDATKLYATHNDGLRLSQFDLAAGNEEEILQSGILIASAGNQESFDALQLGPDGKIYNNMLHVIHEPNRLGLLCNFEKRDFDFSPGAPQRGLNDMVQSFVDQNPYIVYIKPCGGNLVSFQLANKSLVKSVTWDFGDIDSGVNNISTNLDPEHDFSNYQNYFVKATITLKTGDVLVKQKKIVWKNFQVDLGKDSTICDYNSFLLDALQTELSCYIWQDGSKSSNFTATKTGWYWVDVRMAGCVKRDSIFLRFEETPVSNLEDQMFLCENEELTLNPEISNAEYLWSTSSTLPIIRVQDPGLYWVDIFKDICLVRDSFLIVAQPTSNVNLPSDTIFCESMPLRLEIKGLYDNILWSNGSTSNSIEVTSAGEYWVGTELNTCSSRDTIHVSEIRYFHTTSIDTLVCESAKINLNVETPGSNYMWSTGSNNPAIEVTSPGTYQVLVENQCFSKELTFTVREENCDCDLFIPTVFTPNGDCWNPLFSPVFHQNVTSLDFRIFNRWGDEIFHTTTQTKSWDGQLGGLEASTGVYYWVVNYGCIQNGSAIKKEKRGYVQLLR